MEITFFNDDTIKEVIHGTTEAPVVGEIAIPYGINKVLTQCYSPEPPSGC